jgi:hypothetical protein
MPTVFSDAQNIAKNTEKLANEKEKLALSK